VVAATSFAEGSSLRHVASEGLPSSSLEFIDTYFPNSPITTAYEKDGSYTVVLNNDLTTAVLKTVEFDGGKRTFTVNVREPKVTATRSVETERGTHTYTVGVRDNVTIVFNGKGEWKKVTTSGSSLDTIAFANPSIPAELKSLYEKSGITSIVRGSSAVFGDGTKVTFSKDKSYKLYNLHKS